MHIIRVRSSQFVVIIVIVALIALASYRQMTRRAEKRRTAEQAESRSFNRSLAKLSTKILSPYWHFRPSFLNSPNGDLGSPKIPHIIHQVWDTNMVPMRYEKWIKTWKALHPTWEHWFWTLDDVRDLVVKHYSDHLVLYDSYQEPIFRADVMRYFVLHRFGGIYVDLDMEALKPLDNWTFHYNCLVSEECYEHTYVVREQKDANILNGFIACQRGHPFLKLAIDSLGEFARKDFGNPLYATGPFFFNAVLQQYEKLPSTGNTVTVVPPRYFFPTYDESESDTISGKCYPGKLRQMLEKGQLVCRELLMHSFRNVRSSDAYTDHYWVHAHMYDAAWKMANAKMVSVMAPGINSAKEKLLKWRF